MSALIRVALSKRSLQVRPGERADLVVTIQNFSEIVDRYTVTVEGVDAAWVTISRQEIALFPKDQDQVRISIQPPAGPESRADHYASRILVVSEENPSERTTVDLALEVAPLPALDVTLNPQKQSGMSKGTFTVQVRNQGNVDMTVQLQASDPEDGCTYVFNPYQLILPAGSEGKAHLEVQPKAPLVGEQPKSFPFTVSARPAEAPQLARQVQGTWEQAPPTFGLALRPQKQTGMSEGTFSVQVRNQGTTELTVLFDAADPEEGCIYAFSPSQVVLSAGQQRVVQMKVRPKTPLVGDQSRTFPFTVNARPVESPHLARQAEGEWEQSPPSFEVVLRPQKQSGMSTGTFGVQLNNQSDATLTVQFEANDPEEGCYYSFSPPQIVVPAGQSGQVQLKVQPKAALVGDQGKSYPFTVTARPAEAPSLTRQAQGEWEQTPPAFEVSLFPQKQSGITEGIFSVQVRNRGSGDLTVQLSAMEPQGGCRFTFTPPQVIVPAGQERLVQLNVQPKGRRRATEARIFAFNVTGRPTEAPGLSRQVQGEWQQLPHAGAPDAPADDLGKIRVLGIIGLVLAAVAALGFFLMAWFPESSTSGWTHFFENPASNVSPWFEGFWHLIEETVNGYGSVGGILFMLSTTLLWIIPLQLIIQAIRSLILIAAPSGAKKVRRKFTIIIISAIVLLLFLASLFVTAAEEGWTPHLDALNVGFWITLIAVVVTFLVGLILVPVLVPEEQR
jgi:uncharacterized membrane protein